MWDKGQYFSRINGAPMVNMGIIGIDTEVGLKRLSKLYGTEVKIGGALIMPDANEDRRKYLLIRR